MRDILYQLAVAVCGAFVLLIGVGQANAKQTDSYCNLGICTLPKGEFERIIREAFQEGRESSGQRRCQIILVDGNGNGSDEEYHEMPEYWHVYAEEIDSDRKIAMQYHSQLESSQLLTQYRIALSSDTIEWRSNPNEVWNKSVMGEASDWERTVNMHKGGVSIVDYVRAAGVDTFTLGDHYAFVPRSTCAE